MYYALKQLGCNAELAREYVKDWAWEKRSISHYDQFYFLGKQSRRESMLYGKVDWIVTDSPVMLSAYYAEKHSPPAVRTGVAAAVKAFYAQAAEDGHRHVHVFLQRSKPYLAHGRYQDEAGARAIDDGLLDTLVALQVPFETCDTDEASLRQLLTRYAPSV